VSLLVYTGRGELLISESWSLPAGDPAKINRDQNVSSRRSFEMCPKRESLAAPAAQSRAPPTIDRMSELTISPELLNSVCCERTHKVSPKTGKVGFAFAKTDQ